MQRRFTTYATHNHGVLVDNKYTSRPLDESHRWHGDVGYDPVDILDEPKDIINKLHRSKWYYV